MACTARRGWIALLTIVLCGAHLAACGGGGGDGPEGPSRLPPGSRPTTFIGNLTAPTSGLTVGESDAAIAASPVQVCVAGTSFCTEVDETGAFTLDAGVGGDVVLVFDGPGFTARLALSDVPRGATVRIADIECSTRTGQCHAESVEIVAAPTCASAAASPSVLWPPNHSLVRITIDGVIDPDGDPVSITPTDVVQDEAVDAPGSGNTAPDARLAPLAVRAERSGQGDGRVYTIAFVADDGRGGACTGIVHVCVPHDQGQGGSCVDGGAQFDSLR